MDAWNSARLATLGEYLCVDGRTVRALGGGQASHRGPVRSQSDCQMYRTSHKPRAGELNADEVSACARKNVTRSTEDA